MLTARSLRRRFLLLRGLRWLPTGLIVPVLVLLLVERGLTLTEIGVVGAAQGVVVLLLELPTGGLADSWGRRPVLLVGAAVEVAAMAVLASAGSVTLLLVAFALEGVYRALESGPLDAWYVDQAHDIGAGDQIEDTLAVAGAVAGGAMALGGLLSGGLVALAAVGDVPALVVPVVAAIALRLTELAAIALLMVEPRPARTPETPGLTRTVKAGLRAVTGSRPLLALVAAEIAWGLSANAFEHLPPVRLSELVGSAEQAAALMGPISAAAWAAVAIGSACIPVATRRYGAARTALGLRVLQGVAIAAIGLAAGPVGLMVAYLATYGLHGATTPAHQALVHREAVASTRATVLSVESMAGLGAAAFGGVLLGLLADASGTVTAIVVGGLILALSAPCYEVVRRLGTPVAEPPVTAVRRIP